MFALLLGATGAVVPAPVSKVVEMPPPPLLAPAPAQQRVILPPVDAAKLALARIAAAGIFPDGTTASMLDKIITTSPSGVAGVWLDMTLTDLIALVTPPGTTPPAPTGMPDANLTLRQMMAKHDPYAEQRIAAIHDVAVAEARRLGPKFEPAWREGLANSMARRFEQSQLDQIARFFSTEGGRAFANQMYLMWLDPAVVRASLSVIPALRAELPGVMQRITAANDRFPSPKKKVEEKKDAPALKKVAPRRKK